MADVRFKPKSGALDELIKSGEVMAELEARGQRILASAGSDHYEMQTWVGRRRPRATVRTKDADGAAYEQKNHALLRAFDSGRG